MNTNNKMTVEDVAKNIPNWRDRDAELVTGIFKNNECPGMPAEFMFKAYPGDEYKEWYFSDGEKYNIPRGIARHLNSGCCYNEYKLLPNETGQFGTRQAVVSDGSRRQNDTMQVQKKIYRYSFQSLEFQDDDLDLVQSKLVQVTKAIK